MVMHGPTLGDTQHAQHYDNGVRSRRAGLSGLPRMTLWTACHGQTTIR